MQLGSFLDAAKNKAAVSHPVKFKVAARNAQQQPVTVEVEAVLVYVDEEERAAFAVEAETYLAEKFKDKTIPQKEQLAEEWTRWLAVALRDKADPATPFAKGGVDELRPALVDTVSDRLAKEYRAFMAREFNPNPPEADREALREQAAGK